MAIDLKAAIRKWAIDTLPYDQNDAAVVAEINGKDARELLIVYHNWMFRHVLATPRKVHVSAAFAANPVAAQLKADLDALVVKIEKGEELKPHLSTRVATVLDSSIKKLHQRKDLDLMLIEWEIHHLHISQDVQPNGFVKRDDPLLFAVFHPNDAYLLDVMTHNDFNRNHIMEIMVREFPDAGLIHEVKAGTGQKILGLARKDTEDERNALRKAGINSMVEVDGKVYKPAGGMNGVGTAVRASRAADQVIIATERLEAALRESPLQFQRYAQEYSLTWPANPTFEFGLLEPNGLVFKELTTNLALAVA